jgi:signal transduction histidine kinase
VIQVAETLQTLQESMEDVRNLMLGGSAALLIAALASGWFLTRRALAPVSAVTEAARHIAETGRFERRLGSTAPRDELSALTATFDLMIARIEQMLSHQRQFLADTSHELRTPLSIIRGNLDFVRRGTTDQDYLESLRESEVEAARMSRLVTDLLMLARADSGEFLALQPLRFDELVHQVTDQARALAVGRQITALAPVEVTVLGDPDRLRQALWNLLENALRYTPEGGKIGVTLCVCTDEARIEVADTGPGVPPEHEARIFERFYRVDPSRSRATGGTGLGLAIVKHIIEAHGGRVTLRNQPGQGATFVLTLPRFARVPEPAAARSTSSALPS